MRIGSLRAPWVFGLLVLLSPAVTQAAILRNLKQGDRGADVRELQQILNRDPDTRIAASGPGSPGNETDFFGTLTLAAVKRFQKKYAADVLLPVGLTSPSGFIGSQTRLMLLRAASGAVPPPATHTPISRPQGRPVITSIVPEVVTGNTEELVILGNNFTAAGNTVLISSEDPDRFSNLPSSDGKTIRVRFHLSLIDILREAARASDNYSEAVIALAENTRGFQGNTPRGTVPVVIAVQNADGRSNLIQITVDIVAALNDTSS